jgi:hypothetical protein
VSRTIVLTFIEPNTSRDQLSQLSRPSHPKCKYHVLCNCYRVMQIQEERIQSAKIAYEEPKTKVAEVQTMFRESEA